MVLVGVQPSLMHVPPMCSRSISAVRAELPRSVRAIDQEVTTVVVMKPPQGFDDQKVDREPDGSAPVGVAAEQAGVGLTRLVADLIAHPREGQFIRMVEVVAADR